MIVIHAGTVPMMGSLLAYIYGCIVNLKLHYGRPIIVSTVYTTFNAGMYQSK